MSFFSNLIFLVFFNPWYVWISETKPIMNIQSASWSNGCANLPFSIIKFHDNVAFFKLNIFVNMVMFELQMIRNAGGQTVFQLLESLECKQADIMNIKKHTLTHRYYVHNSKIETSPSAFFRLTQANSSP